MLEGTWINMHTILCIVLIKSLGQIEMIVK